MLLVMKYMKTLENNKNLNFIYDKIEVLNMILSNNIEDCILFKNIKCLMNIEGKNYDISNFSNYLNTGNESILFNNDEGLVNLINIFGINEVCFSEVENYGSVRKVSKKVEYISDEKHLTYLLNTRKDGLYEDITGVITLVYNSKNKNIIALNQFKIHGVLSYPDVSIYLNADLPKTLIETNTRKTEKILKLTR